MGSANSGVGSAHSVGILVSINISAGGVPKRSVSDAQVSLSGLKGDDQDDKTHHGGPDRAVCIYSLERIRELHAEGHPIDVGTAGENMTVAGLRARIVGGRGLLRRHRRGPLGRRNRLKPPEKRSQS